MTKEEFIKKWNVAYESKEQQIEFANEMKADLEGLVELHPSILHINAKNLNEQTVKMINKMVEKAIEMESKIAKIYKLECINEDGNLECNGYYFNRERAEKEGKKMDEYPMNKKYSIIQKVVEIEMDDHSTENTHLTAENTRLREALEKIANGTQPYNDLEAFSWAATARSIANEALKPDNSK